MKIGICDRIFELPACPMCLDAMRRRPTKAERSQVLWGFMGLYVHHAFARRFGVTTRDTLRVEGSIGNVGFIGLVTKSVTIRV